jgi:hypothetical protein
MPKTIWRVIPDNITLSDPENWIKTETDHFQATRCYLAIVEHRAYKPKTTPPLVTVPVPSGVKPVLSEKKIVVTTYTEAITETIQTSVTTKLATESSFKNAASLKDGISAEIQTKLSTEISTGLSSQLSNTKTYQVQSTHEVVNSLSFESPQNPGTVTKSQFYLYMPVWPVTWNLYLYRIEILKLSYERFTLKQGVLRLLKKVRSMEPLQIVDPKVPLAQFLFYEPQAVLASNAGDYDAEVINPDEISIQPLTEQCSKLAVPTQTMSLEGCASIAFPETEEESILREEARKVNKERKRSPLRAEFERVRHRRSAGKSFATKKRARRSAVKRSAAKKSSAKRSAVKKSSAKRSAVKKSSAKRSAAKKSSAKKSANKRRH